MCPWVSQRQIWDFIYCPMSRENALCNVCPLWMRPFSCDIKCFLVDGCSRCIFFLLTKCISKYRLQKSTILFMPEYVYRFFLGGPNPSSPKQHSTPAHTHNSIYKIIKAKYLKLNIFSFKYFALIICIRLDDGVNLCNTVIPLRLSYACIPKNKSGQ